MLRIELEARARDLGRDQGIDDDEPPVAFDHGHVRDVEAADLIDPVRHLEEAMAQVEPSQAPEARIDRGRGVLVGEEGVVAETPDDASLVVLDLDLGQRAEEATPRVLEVAGIVERQRGQRGPVEHACAFGRILGILGRSGHRCRGWYSRYA